VYELGVDAPSFSLTGRKETYENVLRFPPVAATFRELLWGTSRALRADAAPPLVIDKDTIDWALPIIRGVLQMD